MMTDHLTIIRLPELTAVNLPSIMESQKSVVQNQETAIPMLWQGILEMDIPVGSDNRTAKLYVPKKTPQGTTFVFLNVPSGVQTISFLKECGWLDCADRLQLPLFVAEPGEGGWKTPELEQGYIEACAQALFRGIYVRGGMSVYVVGYGPIGICLHRYVINTPLRVAAAVFANASAVPDAVIDKAAAASLDGNGMTFDIKKREVPVPVWILENKMNPQSQRAAQYWIDAISGGVPTRDPILGNVYPQTRKSVCTPDGCIARVCVKETGALLHAPGVTDVICDFLRSYARYGKFGPYGNALVSYVDYEKVGVEVRYYPDSDGEPRECLVYVPRRFQYGRKLPIPIWPYFCPTSA